MTWIYRYAGDGKPYPAPVHFNPKFLMVYFTVPISHNEIVNLRRHLSDQNYCLIQLGAASGFYGIVVENSYHTLLHALSAETLERLEYLNENEFQHAYEGATIAEVFGNKELLHPM